MTNERNEAVNTNTIQDIVYVAKKNIWLILAILIISTCLGGIYSSFVKPVYTATLKVVYVGSSQEGGSVVNDYNIMNLFVGTIVDFCDEEVVIDRANTYYINYLNEKVIKGDSYTATDYIADTLHKPYSPSDTADKVVFKKNISIIAEIEKGETPKYIFTIKYTDEDPQAAVDKANLLVHAIGVESNLTEKVVIDGEEVKINKYFEGIKNKITNLGLQEVTVNVSKTRIIIISAILGAIVATLVVYVKSLFDNAIKSKGDLESITGADVFAFISNKGGK